MRSPVQRLLLAAVAFTALACDEGDATSLQITVDANMAGSLSLCRLTIPDAAATSENEATGVAWQHRAALTCTTGRFGNLDELTVADMTFSHEAEEDGHTYLRIELPRGPSARWPALLTVTAAGARRTALSAFDPTGRMKEVGENLRLVVLLPQDVGTHGALPTMGGVTASADKREASLLVPLTVALTDGPPLVWTVTWERP